METIWCRWRPKEQNDWTSHTFHFVFTYFSLIFIIWKMFYHRCDNKNIIYRKLCYIHIIWMKYTVVEDSQYISVWFAFNFYSLYLLTETVIIYTKFRRHYIHESWCHQTSSSIYICNAFFLLFLSFLAFFQPSFLSIHLQSWI